MSEMKRVFTAGFTELPGCGDRCWSSAIDVDQWGSRIEVYGMTSAEATELRDEVLSAITDFDAQRLRADTAEANFNRCNGLYYECQKERDTLRSDLTAAGHRIAELEVSLKESVSKTIDRAAKLVETRLNEYVDEHGFTDPDTGTMEFPGDGAEYVEELDCIASFIRALNQKSEGESHE